MVAEAGAGDTPSMPSTGRQTLWNYLIFALSKSSTLLMTVVVARILTPTEFGVFALAVLVVNLFDYVKDLGVASALVQNRRDWRVLAPTGLTLSVLFGLLASGLLAAFAGVATVRTVRRDGRRLPQRWTRISTTCFQNPSVTKSFTVVESPHASQNPSGSSKVTGGCSQRI